MHHPSPAYSVAPLLNRIRAHGGTSLIIGVISIGVMATTSVAVSGVETPATDSSASVTNVPDVDRTPILPGMKWPAIESGEAAPGKTVLEQLDIPPYAGSQLKHRLCLPSDWVRGRTYPVLIEYLGNTGTVLACAGMGYGITGGKGFIMATLPYAGKGLTDTAVWWGDVEETVAYAKLAVPAICRKWGGDPDRVILAGFSRGAIACNYIGLHDDEISRLWRGMIAVSHYDGLAVKWGMSSEEQARAPERLRRLGSRPQLVCAEYRLPSGRKDGKKDKSDLMALIGAYPSIAQAVQQLGLVHQLDEEKTREFVAQHLPTNNITFLDLNYVNHSPNYFHHDIPERKAMRDWLQAVLQVDPGKHRPLQDGKQP